MPNMRKQKFSRELIRQFLTKLRGVLREEMEIHVRARDVYTYMNPPCLKDHVRTANDELGKLFTEEQMEIVVVPNLCSYGIFGDFEGPHTRKIPCMVLYRILGYGEIIVDRLESLLECY